MLLGRDKRESVLQTESSGAVRRRGPSAGRDSARERLVRVGERLFARGGINGVSLREIASKADQKNHSAVQYHFGSREGLVQAIFDSRMLEMEPTRERMLHAAELAGTLGEVRALMDIVYLPQLELEGARGSQSYAAFLAQYLLRVRSHEFGVFSPHTPPHLARTLVLLRRSVAHLPEEVAQRRLVSCSLMFLHILVEQGHPESRASEGFEAALEDTLSQMVRVLAAPYELA